MKLLLYSMRIKNPVVLESIALPCLRILQHVIRPAPPTTSQKYKASRPPLAHAPMISFMNMIEQEKGAESLSTVKSGLSELHVDSQAWLSADPNASFASWRKNMPKKGRSFIHSFIHSFN